MDLREMLLAQFPAFFLLSILFLIAHLRVRKRSAVKSVLWVLLSDAPRAGWIWSASLGLQGRTGPVKSLFGFRFWSCRPLIKFSEPTRGPPTRNAVSAWKKKKSKAQ